MAGHSRLKDGVASARLCPAIHVFSGQAKQDVDARQPATPRLRRALVPVRRSFSEGGHKAGMTHR